jgi:hypothetical protein
MVNIMKRPVIIGGNAKVGSHGTGANAGPERNALGARLPRAGDSHSKPWAFTSEDPLKDDQDAQKIIRCGQFLAQMFAGGTFQDDAACH